MDPGNRSDIEGAGRQTASSARKNTDYFGINANSYSARVKDLDTYVNIRHSINQSLAGISNLLDIGNGGVFDYDTSIPARIEAVDLVFEKYSPPENAPRNITFRGGSALGLPYADCTFDGVLMVMLIHHMVGKSVKETRRNMKAAIGEAFRVLSPGGKLIIVESCVPEWFYALETMVFAIAGPIVNRISSHPFTFQFPAAVISRSLKAHASQVEHDRIRKGRWVLQFGVKVPGSLTPISIHKFMIMKPG
jgi:SAM-dependent methyltransferase